MNCSACGAENDGAPSTCDYCGSPLAGAAPAASPPGPGSPVPAPQPHPGPAAAAPGAGVPNLGGAALGGLAREKQQGAKLGLGVFAVISLLCGVGGFVFSGQAQELRVEAGRAMVRTPEDATETTGLVCIEAVVAEVAQPYRIPDTEITCLYVEETREKREDQSRSSRSTGSGRNRRTKTHTTKNEHTIPAFKLGPLEVKTAGASYRGTTQLHRTHDRQGRDEITVTWNGIKADTPVTVLGHSEGGTISSTGGGPLLISTAPSHAALLDSLQSSATMLKLIGVLGILIGLGAGGAAAVAFRG